MLHASLETGKAGEQGKREGEGMALALLDVAAQYLQVLLERVKIVGKASEDGPPTR